MGAEKGKLIEEDGRKKIVVGSRCYQLEEIIGQTNASKVNRARLKGEENKKLALKILFLNAQADFDEFNTLEDIDERVKVYQNIDHPNIAELEDFFYLQSVSDMPVIVREFIPGKSLQEEINEGRMYSPQQALKMFNTLLEIADYLETSQTREIVVRDIKPGNLIIDEDGEITLTDLELCTSSGQTTTGGRGTHVYMPQEQVIGGEPTAMWDRYAIAKTLEHILTGQVPEHGVPVNLSSGINIPVHVKEILYRMTVRDVRERYSSAREIMIELETNKLNGNRQRNGTDGGKLLTTGENHEEGLVVRNGSRELATMNKQLTLISKYSRKVNFGKHDEGQKELLQEFIQRASAMDQNDPDYLTMCNLAKALRLHLEARSGFTKKEEFFRAARELVKAGDYDICKDNDEEIILVDPVSDPVRVMHIYGPNNFYVDELRPETSVDYYIKNFSGHYWKSWDPELRKKYVEKKDRHESFAVGSLITASVAGLVGSMAACFGYDNLLLLLAGISGTAAIDYGIIKLFDWDFERLENQFEKENAELKKPYVSRNSHLPCALTKAFFPKPSGE